MITMRIKNHRSSTELSARFGFTIMELAIVGTIIAIIAMIALPNYMRAIERSNCAQGMHQVKTLRQAALAYFRERQTFTGMTIVNLGTLVGETFTNNADWSYVVTVTGPNSFTVQASRLRGPWTGDIITVNQAEDYSSSTYPYDDPGNW